MIKQIDGYGKNQILTVGAEIIAKKVEKLGRSTW